MKPNLLKETAGGRGENVKTGVLSFFTMFIPTSSQKLDRKYTII
jgi:hypothetical protein